MSRIVCVGETFVDLLAQADSLDIGSSEFFSRAAGGAVSNVAVGIARLGGSAAFVGTVGRDPLGRFLVRTLAHENVNIDGLRSVDTTTSVIMVARGPDGARDFYPLNSPGAEAQLSTADIDDATFSGAQCVHFGGVLLSAEPGRSACMAAAKIGAPAGFVSFDPNVRPRLFSNADSMRRVIMEGCEAAHLVKCSEEDLRSLGLDEGDPAQLLRGSTRAAIVTLGPRGCRWATAGGATGESGAPRVSSVDTTGAGDAFMAALLWRLCYHHRAHLGAQAVSDAVRWAVVAGALACERAGAIASLPRVTQLEAMLEFAP